MNMKELPAGLSLSDRKRLEFFTDNGAVYAQYHGRTIHFSEVPCYLLDVYRRQMKRRPLQCKHYGITSAMLPDKALEIYLMHEYGEYDNVPDLDASGKTHRELSRDEAIRDYNLTPREVEVLQLICQNNSVPQIAERIFISPATVQNHCANIKDKLNCHTRLDLVYFALRNKLFDAA
jgi:DNA-binding CsgD family transcriptional regulator